MAITELLNSTCNFASPEGTAGLMASHLKNRPKDAPSFHLFRIVGRADGYPEDLDALRTQHPDTPFEYVDLYTFFALFKRTTCGPRPRRRPRPPRNRRSSEAGRGSETRIE